jgi:uncharacterized membrane protein
MVVSSEPITQQQLHSLRLNPLHGILLAATVPLFLGVLLSDIAYASSYQIQWSNFASWLNAAALVFCGFALLWTIISVFTHPRARYFSLYLVLLAITWVVGFFNSFIHARDAWAMMPTGLILSVIVFLLACASSWIGFFKFGVGGQR